MLLVRLDLPTVQTHCHPIVLPPAECPASKGKQQSLQYPSPCVPPTLAPLEVPPLFPFRSDPFSDLWYYTSTVLVVVLQLLSGLASRIIRVVHSFGEANGATFPSQPRRHLVELQSKPKPWLYGLAVAAHPICPVLHGRKVRRSPHPSLQVRTSTHLPPLLRVLPPPAPPLPTGTQPRSQAGTKNQPPLRAPAASPLTYPTRPTRPTPPSRAAAVYWSSTSLSTSLSVQLAGST